MFIVATISKNSYSKDKIIEILKAGATVLRFNFSHGSPEDMQQKIAVAREAIKELGLNGQINIMADLPGDKIRLGKFTPTEYQIEKGQEVIFKSIVTDEEINIQDYIPVNYNKIGTLVKINQEISCADGELGFIVKEIIDEDTIKAEALNTRHIPSLKAFNIGTAVDGLNHITEQTLIHIKELGKIQPEWIAFSFVNSKEYINKLKALIEKYNPGLTYKIVSKLETEGAYKNYKEILEETDYPLVARGDLGITVPIEKLGIYQKYFVEEGIKAGKPVIVSTQIIDSVTNQYTPQRAEVLDLTNIVLDGASGIMLAKETGISLTPGASILMARKIINFVEQNIKKEKKTM